MAEDIPLTELPGCLCRLRAFDTEWQARQGIAEGDRVVSIDLDVVITGTLDPLFDRPEDFVIVEGANSQNPDPTNGSLWMFRAGTHRDIWEDFSLEAVKALKYHEFPDDQGWFFHKVPDFAGWKVGPEHGLYCFKKPGWPKGDSLPPAARIVCFPGFRDPAQFAHLDWVKSNWRVHPE